MRRVFITLISALLAVVPAVAQDGAADNTRPMWGIRAAFDINIPGDWHGNDRSVKMYKSGVGATLGAVYNVYLGKNFYLEPGVSLFYDKYSYDDLILTDDNGTQVDSDPSIYKAGVRVPVVVGYSFNIAGRLPMVVFTGPELSYAFAGKVSVKHKELVEDFPTDLFGAHGQRRVDCAWKFGVGFPLDSFLVSVDAAVGMTDLLKEDMSFRENRVSVSLTYYF